MAVEMKKCFDCGAAVEKSGASGMLRCGPCGGRYRATLTQRRREGRLKIKKKGTLQFKGMGTHMPVFVEDVSYHGARIRYTGDASLFFNRSTQGDTNVILDIGKLKLHTFAKVVWTNPVNNEESRVGLRLNWHT